MSHVQWGQRPDTTDPVLIAAFEGWNDAGDAASSALRYLRDRWDSTAFAEIDPEEFYDFTSTRPEVRLDDADQRTIRWPANRFFHATIPDGGRDVIFLLGTEPQLRWKTFCGQVIEVAKTLEVSLAITLGALLAEVAHTRPTSIVGTTQHHDLRRRLDLRPSRYEGPTGIVGVLHTLLAGAAVPSLSLWAAVPTYVPGAQSPKATLALVERAAALLETPLVTTDLEIAAASYERQINELVAEDEETTDYVTALEERHDNADDEFPTGTSLIEEVERFLRDRNAD